MPTPRGANDDARPDSSLPQAVAPDRRLIPRRCAGESSLGPGLIKKVYELDPLLCAFCSGQLKVRSFTLELQEIRRFLRTLGETTPDALPLAHAPPTETGLVYELL